MSTTRDSIERTLTAIVPLPCGHHWWVYSAPTFALGGLAVAWFFGRNSLLGAGIGGLLGYLIHRYSQEIPFTRASQVTPALLAAAIAEANVRAAAIADERDAANAQRITQGRTPMVSLGRTYTGSADHALVSYCRGPYDQTTHGNVSQHTQECSAGGWREAIPAFRCFRAPSFQY
jgi:hypothetical protein